MSQDIQAGRYILAGGSGGFYGEVRSVKIPLYAEDGITEVWLVNLKANCIEVYRQLTAEGYHQIGRFDRSQTLSIQAFAGIEIAVSEVLGAG